MESLANTIRKMRTVQRTPVQQPTQVVVEQQKVSGEFDYAAETQTEETRLIQVPGKTALIPEDTQGVAPMTPPSPEVFAACARSISRTDIPPLVESDVSRYLKKKALPLPKPIVEEKVIQESKPAKFKSVAEYVQHNRNKRAQQQLKIIDNA